MDRYYDHWERLVEAVMRREELRRLSLETSRSPSTRSIDSDLSFSSSSRYDDVSSRPTPLHPEAVKLRLAQSLKKGNENGSRKVPAKRRTIWKGLSIFGGLTSKKDYGKEEKEVQWGRAQRTLHGFSSFESTSEKYNHHREAIERAEEAKRRAEIARFQELYTLKGHIESVVKAKGLDLESINHYYTV